MSRGHGEDVAPHMQQQGSGAIVHVTARPAIEPSGDMTDYGVCEAALAHLTGILDVELRLQGIGVRAVAPQLLDTPGHRSPPAEVMAHALAPQAMTDVIGFLVRAAAPPVSAAILPASGVRRMTWRPDLAREITWIQ